MKNLLHCSLAAVLYLVIAGLHLSKIEDGKAVGALHSRSVTNDPKYGIFENTSLTHFNLPNTPLFCFSSPDPSVKVRPSITGSASESDSGCAPPGAVSAAGICDSITYSVEPYSGVPGECCWRLRIDSKASGCYFGATLTLQNHAFINAYADTLNGWTMNLIDTNQIYLASTIPVPLGVSYPLYWCLPSGAITDSLHINSALECPGVMGGICDTTLFLSCSQGYICCEDNGAFGKVWRTGANEATEVTFYKNTTLGGKAIKAGTYSLFTIPNEDKWTIVLNSGLNEWGAYEYKEAEDVLRYEVPAQKTASTVEAFSIVFEKTDNGANMILAWDDTMVSVPFVF